MVLLIGIVILAVAFEFINGFHDAANAIATVVATRVLTPLQAVIWSALFNFVAFFIAKFIIGNFGVADTVAKTVHLVSVANPALVIVSGLLAAIIWNLLTWKLGIPSSSSHTLIGGFAGAGIIAGGFHAIYWAVIGIIVLFIVLAPLIGMIIGNILTLIVLHLAKKSRPRKADKWFKSLQLVSSAMLGIGHGLNDSQQVIGIMAAALIAETKLNPHLNPILAMGSMKDLHDWIPVVCFSAIAVGTMVGGWKIMKTIGNRITKITPMEGLCVQVSGAITLFLTEVLHVPVSSTHVITGSVVGVGASKRLSAVRWGVTKDLVVAWILTIPISAVLAIIIYAILHCFFK